ncbi:MAG: hypothetical protein RIS73_650 [Bacteroidota bacterium]|jgi:acetyltransferase-like isoleucine patch superfamily enzyme
MNKIFVLIVRIFTKKNSCLRKMPPGLVVKNYFNNHFFKVNGDAPFQVHFTSVVTGSKNIILPNNADSVLISMASSGGCYFTVFPDTKLEIGEGSIWAFNVCIQTGNHDFYDHTKYNVSSVKIGKNCWISHAVTITAGVQLGDNVVIGANSVVTKSFPSNVVIAGCPAKIIKHL